MVDTPQGPFACTRNKHESNDDRTPHTGIGGAAGGCRRRRSFRHQHATPRARCFFSAGWRTALDGARCCTVVVLRHRKTSTSLFSGTKTRTVGPHLIVNARLRRAQKTNRCGSTEPGRSQCPKQQKRARKHVTHEYHCRKWASQPFRPVLSCSPSRPPGNYLSIWDGKAVIIM